MKWKIIIGVSLVVAAGTLIYERCSLARKGERDFVRLGCTGCHFSGAGPNLTHVVRRRNPVLLERFIVNPADVYRERGMKPLNEGYMLMPDMHATSSDASEIVAYLRELDAQ
jgi:hypothetical protein